jgi:Penicillin-insensitive murein endopeptidase
MKELGYRETVYRVGSSDCFCSFDKPVGEPQFSSPGQVAKLVPGGRIRYYVVGPIGTQCNLTLSRIEGSGGHNHSGGPVGTLDRASVVVGLGEEVVNFEAPLVSGMISITGSWSTGYSETDFFDVGIDGLVSMPRSKGIVLIGATKSHPDNHYGVPALIEKLQILGLGYFEKFSKNLFVNDMSLVRGGIFDIKTNWTKPHATHNTGKHVDLNSTSMNELEKTFFKSKALELGFSVLLHEPPEPPHWHLTLG